jgi:hypothetical protein
MYEQMSTLAAAGATPLIGTAGRIGRRIAGAPNEAMMRMAGSVTPTAAAELAALTAKSTTEAVPITSEPDIQKLISQVPSYYMEEWTQNAGLPQDVVAKYWKLGNDQRDVPERAMVQAQKIIGGGVIFPAIEHIGDLTNRMTPKHSLGFAYEETLGKAKRYLASLKSGYGFRREHEENLKSNADYNKVPYEEHKAKVDAALLNYADAHRALTVYNPLQRLARDTSVALGEQRFEDAGNLLDEFVNRIPTQEAFVEEIKKFDPNFAAPMSNYSLKRQQQRSAGSREAPTAADDLAELTANGLTTSLANPSATGGTLGDALSQLNITPQRVEKWRSSREGMRQEKVSQVQQAAEELRAGNISTEEYQRTVQQYQPIKPLGAVQKMPTVEEVAMALGKNAETSPGIVGVNVNLPDGTRVASRLDIPAYDKYDTWVVSLHDGNKTGGNAIGYGQAAVLNDVNFMSSAKAALNIATGKSAKGTIARIYGNWENRDPSAIAQQARDILSGKAPDASDWIEVGMNPYRHSYFYRKSDGMPVASAEQVIQVGPLVLAKKPVTRPVESPEHQIDTPMGTRYFKKGGNVERVRNDNRRYL